MCTPWTIPRLVRWRVRDWASCFFPLDDEPSTCRTSSPQMPIKNMVFDTNGDHTRGNKSNKKMSRHKSRRNKEKKPQPKDAAIAAMPVETVPADDSRWPHSSDEDYIVFCFREDGAFDVVKDGKPETPNRHDCTSRTSRPINRKLNYVEEVKTVERFNKAEKLNRDGHDICPTNDGDVTILDQKDEEEESIYFDTESPTNGIRRRYQIEEVANADRVMVSAESSESNQSDGSTGSFAFPVLGIEPLTWDVPSLTDWEKYHLGQRDSSVGFGLDGESCANAKNRRPAPKEAQGPLCGLSVL